MKIIIEVTPKEIAELLKEIKAQPDITLDQFLSTNTFSSTLNKNF